MMKITNYSTKIVLTIRCRLSLICRLSGLAIPNSIYNEAAQQTCTALGTVASVFDTKHAIALVTDSGAEMLIHVGLETVTLNGKYFTPKVKDSDRVKAGDLLLEFDLEAIKKDFQTFTPVLVTNADDYASINLIKTSGPVKVGDQLYTAKA